MRIKLEKREKGIMMVNLVVTIIVLLILASVSIATLIGDNGILKQAEKAKKLTEDTSLKEEIELILLQIETRKNNNSNDATTILEKAFKTQDNNARVEKSNAIYEVSYKGNDILVSNDFEYIEKVEPEIYSNWEYTKEGKVTKYKGNSKDILIPNYINGTRIKEIDWYLFQNSDIDSLKISEGIEIIGYAAFYKTNIKEIIIPDSMITIASNAFFDCAYLERVEFGKNLRTIGPYAFFNNSALQSCSKLPDSLEVIGFAAFQGCSNMKMELRKTPNLKQIDAAAFRYCKKIVGDAIIPNGQTVVESSTFEDCYELNGDIIIPDSVTTIKYAAFANLRNIKGNLILPDNIEVIENNAFTGCNQLTGNLKIPSQLNVIEEYTFFDCGFNGTLTIPNSVRSISNETSFRGTKFQKIVIYNSEENIPRNLFLSTANIEYIE